MERTRMGQSMRRSHYLQRLQLELTLETIPRDSRYSTQLIDLMKREEVALRDNSTAAPTAELTRRVDEALRVETEKFFNKTVEQNVKRWNALQKKIEGELQRFKEEMTTHPEITSNSSSSVAASRGKEVGHSDDAVGGSINCRIPTTEELDRETLRLEEDYNQNWHKYEEHNLKTAFTSQVARVENDWIAQEMALADDFDARKAQLTGASALDSPSRQAAGNSDRWQHPEKQKTLIHTAPVLSPTAMRKSKDEHPSADLDRLQRQYRSAIENLEKQKAAAIRWMSRQEIRLMTQCKETASERKAIAAVIRQEISSMPLLGAR